MRTTSCSPSFVRRTTFRTNAVLLIGRVESRKTAIDELSIRKNTRSEKNRYNKMSSSLFLQTCDYVSLNPNGMYQSLNLDVIDNELFNEFDITEVADT